MPTPANNELLPNDVEGNSQMKPFQSGVEVKKSLIPDAGQGLFSTNFHAKSSLVCEYKGIAYDRKDAIRLSDKSYLMNLGEGRYIDARTCPNVLARYINDPRCKSTPEKYNVKFVKYPEQDLAQVVALRDIQVGEELYVDYGLFYWLAYNMIHPNNRVRTC